jgi:hypothetical protein
MMFSPRKVCPKCHLITDHLTGPLGPERCPYDRLREAVGGEVSAAEDRQLHWLARGDFETIDVLEALFWRLRAAAPAPAKGGR